MKEGERIESERATKNRREVGEEESETSGAGVIAHMPFDELKIPRLYITTSTMCYQTKQQRRATQ